jgi:hypothetical protein
MTMPVRRLLACLVIVVASAIGFSSTALAGGGAAYQIAFSNNCNNPAVCFNPAVAGSLGGDWGSIRLNSGGSGTAEFTSATHQTPGVPTGAVHYSLVLAWNVLSSPLAPPPAALTADPNGNYLVITVVNIPSLGYLITPATPGHYKFQGATLGMPGVNFMVQINAV